MEKRNFRNEKSELDSKTLESGVIKLGKSQNLKVVKNTEHGVYLGTEEDKVLLPKKEVPENTTVGDTLRVFVYRDSQERQ